MIGGSRQKVPVARKMFPFDDVIMAKFWICFVAVCYGTTSMWPVYDWPRVIYASLNN